MRIIPKKTKIIATLWRNITIIDAVILVALVGIGFVIISSDFWWRWFLLIPLFFVGLILVMGEPERKIYLSLTYALKHLINTKEYSKSKGNLQKIIPSLSFSEVEGVIDYGGYYGCAISIDPIEFRLYSPHMQQETINNLARTLNYLALGERMQIIKIDRPINFDNLSKNIYDKIVEEESKPNSDKNKTGILKIQTQTIDILNNLNPEYHQYFYVVLYNYSISNLINTRSAILNNLSNLDLECKNLSNKEFATLLKYSYTHQFNEREFDNLKEEDYLKNVYPKKIIFKKRNYFVDDIYCYTSIISDYPLSVGNAWGSALFNIDNTKVVLTLEPLDSAKAIKQINKTMTELLLTSERINKASDIIDNQTHFDTMQELLENLKRENEVIFNTSITITAYNQSGVPNREFATSIKRAIETNTFSINPLGNRQLEGFLHSTLTMYPQSKYFYRGINSTSLAAVFPFTQTMTLDEKGYMLGNNSYPVMLDIWKWRYDKSQKFTNANGFVVGTSGSGKSFFMKLLSSYLFADNVKLFILDPENEYNWIVHNFKGKFIDVGTARNGRINPFHIYSMLTEDGTSATSEATFHSHLNLLSSFFKIILEGISSDAFIELNNIIVKTYSYKHINHDTDLTKLSASDYPIFDDLYEVILNEKSLQDISPVRKHNLELCDSYIKQFTKGERNSSLWNGYSTLEANEDLVVFNFQSLFMSKNYVQANAQMLLVMRFLEQQISNIREMNRKSEKIIRSLIAVDEGYLFVNSQYPIALDFIYMMFKRARKYDLSMLFTTQNLSDLVGNKEIIQKSISILSNSQFSYIFKLKPNEMTVLNEVYNGRINETEMEEIIGAQKGQCFLIESDKQRTSFQIVAPEIIQDFFESPKDVSVEEEFKSIMKSLEELDIIENEDFEDEIDLDDDNNE